MRPKLLSPALFQAYRLSRDAGGSPMYVGETDADFVVTDDPNDSRAVRWRAEVSALPDPSGRYSEEG
jgi:hypothetical protein